MLLLRDLQALVQRGHAHLATGQNRLPDHDNQKRQHHQDDGEEPDDPAAGGIAAS
jgi:hypothetical protein